MRPGLFVPIKWRLPECPRLILPLAVNLKRFLAPRWVFNFSFGFDAFLGMAVNPLDKFLCRWLRRTGQAPPLQNYNVTEEGGPKSALHSPHKIPTILASAFFRADYCDCGALDDGCPAGLATLTPFFGASKATRTLPSMRGMVSIWPWSPISMSRRFILARPLWPSPRKRMIWLLRT